MVLSFVLYCVPCNKENITQKLRAWDLCYDSNVFRCRHVALFSTPITLIRTCGKATFIKSSVWDYQIHRQLPVSDLECSGGQEGKQIYSAFFGGECI